MTKANLTRYFTIFVSNFLNRRSFHLSWKHWFFVKSTFL